LFSAEISNQKRKHLSKPQGIRPFLVLLELKACKNVYCFTPYPRQNQALYRNGKLLIKPSKASIQRFLKEIKDIIRKGVALPTEVLIHSLNRRLTGWVNCFRSSVSSRVFSKVAQVIFRTLFRWGYKRHARKGKRWIVKQYFTPIGRDNWWFYCMTKNKNGKSIPLYLKYAADTKIRRHVKVKSAATPFDPLYKQYFKEREQERKRRSTISNAANSAGLKLLMLEPYAGKLARTVLRGVPRGNLGSLLDKM